MSRNMKRPYAAPGVIRETEFSADSAILVESLVNNVSEIKSTGQEVENYDFSSDSFNQTWE